MDFLLPLAQRWGRLIMYPFLFGAAAVAATFLIAPTFTSTTVLLPPQQNQSAASGALASLGVLAGIAVGGARSPADQYVSLMLSNTTIDRLIDRFDLMQVYDVDERWRARRDLLANTSIAVGKKDGLISVAVGDESPNRAADLANAYVDELRRLTGALALTEAQERRVFFETQMKQVRDALTRAQAALQSSGFTSAALQAEPRAAAEGYAALKAELTMAEVRLQSLRGSFADAAPEVRQTQDTVRALREQVLRLERPVQASNGVMMNADYVAKYREFKYQEALFELMARQYELARIDESRDGVLIQVVDIALPAERKTHPKRSLYGAAAALGAFVLYSGWLVFLARIERSRRSGGQDHERWERLRLAMRVRVRD